MIVYGILCNTMIYYDLVLYYSIIEDISSLYREGKSY